MKLNQWGAAILMSLILAAATGCQQNPDVGVAAPEGSGGTGLGSGAGGVANLDSIEVVSSTLAPGPFTLSVDEKLQLKAIGKDADGNTLSGITFAWNSDDPNILTVSNTGLVTAVTPGGPVTITAASGTIQGTVDVEVDCNSVPSDITSMTAVPAAVTTLGTSAITVKVADCDPATTPDIPDGTLVTFSLSPSSIGTVTAQGSTVNGTATATFTAGLSTGTATVTALVDTLSTSVQIPVSAPPVGSIEFESAVPDVIGVKGGGQTENSIVTYRVKDENGSVAADGTPVLFKLIGPQGVSTSPPAEPERESLTFYSVSTSNGVATTTLISGSVAGTVRIIACVDLDGSDTCDTGEISSSSAPLSIGGGIPSASHFDVARTIINLAGLAYVNEQSQVSAFLADRFGNYNVLTGTSVSFYTEAGAIDRSAVTDEIGTASVVLRTQNPLPIDVSPLDPLNPLGTAETYNNLDCNDYDGGEPFEDANDSTVWESCEHFTDLDGGGYPVLPPGGVSPEPNPRDGWVSVLVTVKGEEAFSDLNGNGIYDSGEPFIDNGGEPFIDSNDNGVYDPKEDFTDQNFNGSYDVGEPFTDLDRGEPFLDKDGNGSWSSGEPFTDLDGDFTYDSSGFGNGVYDPGELFIDVDGDGEWTHGNGVWDSDTTIWVTRRFVFSGGPNAGPYTTRIVVDPGSNWPGFPGLFAVPVFGCANFTVYVSDYNANAITAGSTVSISAGEGQLFGGGTFTVADGVSTGPLVYQPSLCDPDTTKIDPKLTNIALKVNWKTQFGGDLVFDFGLVSGITDYAALAIATPNPLPSGTDAVAYSVTLTPFGGLPPYTWTDDGNLPAGLTLDSATGEISGTPATGGGGDFTPEITVTDSFGGTAVVTYDLHIDP